MLVSFIHNFSTPNSLDLVTPINQSFCGKIILAALYLVKKKYKIFKYLFRIENVIVAYFCIISYRQNLLFLSTTTKCWASITLMLNLM